VLDYLPRAMASAPGVSKATVQRVWSHNKIKPHLTRVFKLSTDPDFEAKFWDVMVFTSILPAGSGALL
jgi:hypothetical protein